MICCSQDHQIDSSYLIQRLITKKIVQLIRSYIVQSINVILKQIVFDGTKIPSNMADYLPIWQITLLFVVNIGQVAAPRNNPEAVVQRCSVKRCS